MRREAMLGLAAVGLAAATLAGQRTASDYPWDLPPGEPPPRLPVGAPMTEARVELGRHLFYDTRLSGNGEQSCATCHIQALAFTDGRARGLGSTGERHPRGAMSLVNVADALRPALLEPLAGPSENGASAERPVFREWARAEPPTVQESQCRGGVALARTSIGASAWMSVARGCTA